MVGPYTSWEDSAYFAPDTHGFFGIFGSIYIFDVNTTMWAVFALENKSHLIAQIIT